MKNYCCTLQVLPSLFIEGEKEGIILENTKWKTHKIGSILLTEAVLFSLLGIYVYAFLYWPCSITGDAPNMGVSLSAALPTFWIGFAVMLCTWMAFRHTLFDSVSANRAFILPKRERGL